MKLTVAVPVYNGESFIAEAIQSILNQSCEDFELLIVDDRSTDGTLNIIKTFSDPRIRFTRNEERLGLPGNWNRCLRLAQGTFICIFHQDDVMMRDNLEKKMALLASDSKIGFVHSGAELQVEPSAPSAPTDWIEKSFEDFQVEGSEYFYKLLFRGNLICAPTVLTRRQLLLDLGGFDEELGFTSDYEMWMKACVGHVVAFLSQPLVRYRWHGKNTSHDYRFERGVEQSDKACQRALKFFQEHGGQQVGEAALKQSLASITRLKRWNASLRQTTAQQKTWITELEKGKGWLEEQRLSLQKAMEEQSSFVAKLEAAIQEQKAWIRDLEKGKNWLDEQRGTWQKLAEGILVQVESKVSRLEKRLTCALIAIFVAMILSPIVLLILIRIFGVGR